MDKIDARRAIGDKFGFKIENTSAEAVKVAVIPAPYLPRDGYDFTPEGNVITRHFKDKTELTKAGLVCDAILDDGTVATNVKVTAAKSTASVRNFINNIVTNPRGLKSMLIVSNNASAFNGEVELRKVSPFGLGKAETIELNKFYDPYQNATDRITVNFWENELELTDDLFMAITVPAGATMDITFRF
ncbi:MAG TPA: hypothetical protein PLL02_00955 [Bacteroidales bacterium]|nr:hypothetical protein [Bacteroidales bacterium]